MVLAGMVMSDWISMLQCVCGHTGSRHVLYAPAPGTTNPVLGGCKDCPPMDPENVIGCDGFTPRTIDDAEKLIRALGIIHPEYMAEQNAKAEEIRTNAASLALPEVDMSKNLAATFASGEQPTPKGTGREIFPLLIADLEERRQYGIRTYGEGLTANNGRDALQDAYQEALDLAVYLRQMIEERANENNQT